MQEWYEVGVCIDTNFVFLVVYTINSVPSVLKMPIFHNIHSYINIEVINYDKRAILLTRPKFCPFLTNIFQFHYDLLLKRTIHLVFQLLSIL